MRKFSLIAALLLPCFAIAADATSYAEAEAGGFTINTENPLGAKVAAAILPVDATTWRDVVNAIDGELLGGAIISSDNRHGSSGSALSVFGSGMPVPSASVEP